MYSKDYKFKKNKPSSGYIILIIHMIIHEFSLHAYDWFNLQGKQKKLIIQASTCRSLLKWGIKVSSSNGYLAFFLIQWQIIILPVHTLIVASEGVGTSAGKVAAIFPSLSGLVLYSLVGAHALKKIISSWSESKIIIFQWNLLFHFSISLDLL